jgi:hypothetical protein
MLSTEQIKYLTGRPVRQITLLQACSKFSVQCWFGPKNQIARPISEQNLGILIAENISNLGLNVHGE